jgi:uncharacterized protein (TIGR02145 family)
VLATVNPALAINTQPTAAQTICPNATTTLSVAATGNDLSYQWKKDGSPTTEGSGYNTADYTTANLTTGATYTVTISNNSCGEVTSGNAVVNVGLPANPTGTGGSRYGTGTVNISATSAGAVIDWYNAASGGNLLRSGDNNFTTPSISVTTSYYAQARNTSSTGCLSASRTEVVATVNSLIMDGPGVTDCNGNFYRTKIYNGVEWMIDNSKKICNVAGCDSPILNCNIDIYGLLYSYNCAFLACPDGWRLPSWLEFIDLIDIFNTVRNSLGEAASIVAWADWNSGDALGGRGDIYNTCQDQGSSGRWWVNEHNKISRAYAGSSFFNDQTTGASSVRCIKNE